MICGLASRTVPSAMLLMLIALVLSIAMQPVRAFADDEEIGQGACVALSGEGTSDDPYVYDIGEAAKVSWKHLVSLNDDSTVERYERHDDSGTLDFAWIFTGGDIENPTGPYWLDISRYTGAAGTEDLPGGSEALRFSTYNKSDYGGTAQVVLNVSPSFKDGQKLALFYYGGNTDVVMHGSGNPIDPSEYLAVDDICAGPDDLVVEDGCVTFTLSYGGNYILVPSEEASTITATADMPQYATRAIPGSATPSSPNVLLILTILVIVVAIVVIVAFFIVRKRMVEKCR